MLSQRTVFIDLSPAIEALYMQYYSPHGVITSKFHIIYKSQIVIKRYPIISAFVLIQFRIFSFLIVDIADDNDANRTKQKTHNMKTIR